MSQRDDRIDAIRGFALLAIFVDHVPHSLLSLASPASFAFSDAAELFVFISGLVSARAYLPLAKSNGIAAATIRAYRRSWELYRAQVVLFVALVAEAALVVLDTGRTSYFDMFRVRAFFEHTDAAIVPMLTLNYQPAYLDIFPMYILFLGVLPLLLEALRWNSWFAVVPSALLYAFVHVASVTLHSFPWHAAWMFNPLAWQFLFVLGFIAGSGTIDIRPLVERRWVIAVAALAVAGIAIIRECSALHAYVPSIPFIRTTGAAVDKSNLGIVRLLNFLALAILAGRFLPDNPSCRPKILWRWLACCGRNSLPVFCLGALLAVLGCVSWVEGHGSLLAQVAFATLGIAALVGFAHLLDWFKRVERRPAKPFASHWLQSERSRSSEALRVNVRA